MKMSDMIDACKAADNIQYPSDGKNVYSVIFGRGGPFRTPKVISPFFNVKRIPRKRKKVLSKGSTWNYKFLTVGQKMWYQLYLENPKYHQFIINLICGNQSK